jgi:hypothetical protein
MSKLKPCPFCGSEAISVNSNRDVANAWVSCDVCLAQSGGYQDTTKPIDSLRDLAAEEWNRRAARSVPEAGKAVDETLRELQTIITHGDGDTMSAKITEAMVEAGARAAFDTWWANRGAGYETSWLSTKQQWLDQARACLAAALSTEPGESEGMVLVPKAALDWLNGEGPDPAGLWFGEFPDDYPQPPGKYWWRKVFRDMCALPAAPLPEDTHHGR